MSNRITLLVVGCDKNVKLLDRFFKSFYQFCSDDNVDVYLSLEKACYAFEDKRITVFHEADVETQWCGRVKKCLQKIQSKAVLIMLDDFIVEAPVNIPVLQRLSNAIEQDDRIAHFALTTVPMKNASDQLYFDFFYERAHFGRYKTTLQCGLWNRNEMLEILNENETPWNYEIYGNIRSFLSDRKYYALCDKKYKPIEYNDGWYCLQGKLNEVEVKRLEDKFGESFAVDGMVTNGGVIVRDEVTFSRRITRRLKITVYDLKYRIIYACRRISKWVRRK